MFARSFAAVAAALIATMMPVCAQALTPSTVLATPSAYQGKPVTVTGKVAKFQTSRTLMGTVAAFQLCDTKCIVVIDEKNATHANGDQVTVSGVFQEQFKGPKRSFKNVVLIK